MLDFKRVRELYLNGKRLAELRLENNIMWRWGYRTIRTAKSAYTKLKVFAKPITVAGKALRFSSTAKNAIKIKPQPHPARLPKIVSETQTNLTVQPTAVPRTALTVERVGTTRHKASPVAYMRAPLTFMVTIGTSCLAALYKVAGRVAQPGQHIMNILSSGKATTGHGTPAEAGRASNVALSAAAHTAPSQAHSTGCATVSDLAMDASKAPAITGTANTAVYVQSNCIAATWIAPVVVDGMLILKQVYNVSQMETVLEVE